MKWRIRLVLGLLPAAMVFAIYVSAQVQSNVKAHQYPKAAEAYEILLLSYQQSNGPHAAGNGAKAPVTLCTGPVMATDGTAKCLYQALPSSGKLRIEMLNGSVQEIHLKQVKQITIE